METEVVASLRREMMISELFRKSPADAMFALRVLTEKCR